MKACFDDITALELWRRDLRYESTLANRHHTSAPVNIATSTDGLKALGIHPASYPYDPVHLAVFSSGAGRQLDGYHIHTLTAKIPSRSLCRLDSELLIISPELCFARLARHTSFEQLIEIGMELCGKYALIPESVNGFEQRSEPLTTVAKISSFLSNTQRLEGIGMASKALKYVRDGSESPMESRQYMLACLPIRFGSYGLSCFNVNGELKLGEQFSLLDGRKTLRCDLLSLDEKTAIEYDSKEEHLGLAAFYRDNNKRNILLDMGVKVFIISAAQILDPEQFDAIMRMVSRATGKRLRRFPSDWTQKRDHLRNEIFKSMHTRCRLSPELVQLIRNH